MLKTHDAPQAPQGRARERPECLPVDHLATPGQEPHPVRRRHPGVRQSLDERQCAAPHRLKLLLKLCGRKL